MKKTILFVLLITGLMFSAQTYSGTVFMRDNSNLYLNQIYVTNLTTQKTVLSDKNGSFKIDAKLGDQIRFTSIVTERKDITPTKEMLENSNTYIELKVAYYEIQEIVLSNFKATGNLRKDVNSLKSAEKVLALQKMIGLPVPKGDGTSPQLPVATFSGGGLTFSLESIYDILSGDRKRKERAYSFEKMNISINNIKNYFGDEYFEKIKIPKNLVTNFLQFVYSSDNITNYLNANNYEAINFYIEKYLPIYQKRLRNSHLADALK